MRVWARDEALNEIKAAESGGFANYQHGFGSQYNYARRKVKTTHSRKRRSENKVLPFLQDPDHLLTSQEVYEMNGTMRHTLKKALGLGGMVKSRFERMLSDAASPAGIAAGKSYHPSPAFDGETFEESYTAFRTELEFCWRLITLGDGKYVEKI